MQSQPKGEEDEHKEIAIRRSSPGNHH